MSTLGLFTAEFIKMTYDMLNIPIVSFLIS